MAGGASGAWLVTASGVPTSVATLRAIFRMMFASFCSRLRTPASAVYSLLMIRMASSVIVTCSGPRPWFSSSSGMRCFFAICSFSFSV